MKGEGLKYKSVEALEKQIEAVNTIRLRDGREIWYPNPEDFVMSERGLKEKYGSQYSEYREDLKKVLRDKIESARTEKELERIAEEILSDADLAKYKSRKKTYRELSRAKKMLFHVALGVIYAALGGGLYKVAEWYAGSLHETRMSVGKNNPILAAQSADRMLFKDDNGAVRFVDAEGKERIATYSPVEQVILLPASFNRKDDIENWTLEAKYQKGEISLEEYQRRHWEFENRKEQGFLDAYEKRIINFGELVKGIREAGERRVTTTLNFGDSSTSGWNSEILTKNALAIARILFSDIHSSDPSLSEETFDDFVQAKHPHEYDSRMYEKIMSAEAERLKAHPRYRDTLDQHWDEVRAVLQSPFMSYDTYSEKMARLDPNHHYVNLGVPGYSTVHGKAYVRRMLDAFEQAGALRYITGATIYFGNNDAVNNGNREDKFYLGEDVSRQFHALGLWRESAPNYSNRTRVEAGDYKDNVAAMIRTLREKEIATITLFVPAVPYDWIPGLRSENDAQQWVEEMYQQGGLAGRALDEARDWNADYDLEVKQAQEGAEIDYGKGRLFAEEAIESDFMVPRRKQSYVAKLAEVAEEQKVNLVNLESILPIRDMSGINTSPKNPENITNDYCHPGEHVNVLLALAEAVIIHGDNAEVKNRAVNELLALEKNALQPIGEDLLRKEVEAVVTGAIAKAGDPAAYRRVAFAERQRVNWRSEIP